MVQGFNWFKDSIRFKGSIISTCLRVQFAVGQFGLDSSMAQLVQGFNYYKSSKVQLVQSFNWFKGPILVRVQLVQGFNVFKWFTWFNK